MNNRIQPPQPGRVLYKNLFEIPLKNVDVGYYITPMDELKNNEIKLS